MSEQLAIRMDNAVTATTSKPSAATDGYAPPAEYRSAPTHHLHVRMSAASGTRSCRVKVYGYQSKLADQADPPAAIASSDKWLELFDTETMSDAADFDRSFRLKGLSDFQRLGTEIVSIGGTTPVLTTAIGFSGEQPTAAG